MPLKDVMFFNIIFFWEDIMEKKLIYDIHDKPKFGQMLIFALQQLLAILAATIAVPTIIGLPTQIPAAIFGAGIGTLIYQLFTKFNSPVFLGSSFAFLNSLFVALAYGYCGWNEYFVKMSKEKQDMFIKQFEETEK